MKKDNVYSNGKLLFIVNSMEFKHKNIASYSKQNTETSCFKSEFHSFSP